jgi:hypothetical protein
MRGRWDLNGLRNRPQAILWSDNFGTIDDTVYINPITSASTSLQLTVPTGTEYDDFIILSDHNRQELSFAKQRIENKQRMINGTMRSYHIADKLQMSVSWDNLPSRSFSKDPLFDENTGKSTASDIELYTVDGGAGGAEILKWYEDHPGPFWMLLAYDKYTDFSGENKYNYLSQYNQIIQVYFSSFDYSVVKRGGTTHDFWNISCTVEEV